MNRIKFFLERWGWHALLLPLFFMVHNYKQYYGLVSITAVLRIAPVLLLIFLLSFLLLLALTRHLNKSLQLVTLLGFIALFFGVIKDFFQYSLHAYFLAKYTVLLPILTLVAFLLSRIIIRKKDFARSNLFQNTLLLLFLAIDITQLAVFNHSATLQKNLLVRDHPLPITKMPFENKSPDVYYLVFDSYPGTAFLHKFMDFDNSPFNKMLEEKGFHVIPDPKSNYNRTAFSIASSLNFGYLKNIRPNAPVYPKDYAEANLTVKEGMVPQFFEKLNYSFYNLSVFDIGNHPAIQKESFLTMPETKILLYNTLIERLENDLLWNLVTGKYAISFVKKYLLESEDEFQKKQEKKNVFNQTALDSLRRIPFQKTKAPKFVYAHLYLPHPPFFYDENGQRNDLKYIMTEASLKNKDLFLSYLKYTNRIIEGIVDTIKNAAASSSVIIIQSDHGFRDYVGGPSNPECFFMNYSAFYFPDHNYSMLYDTLSNINTFPLIFNKYFGTKIPLQKDSSIFLAN